MIHRRLILAAAALLGCMAASAVLAQNASPEGATLPRDLDFRGRDRAGNEATIDEKGLAFTSADEAVRLRIQGRLQYDVGTARLRGVRLGEPLDDADAFRRSRVESYLTIHDQLELAFRYDFASRTSPINDALIAWRAAEPFIFTVGHMKEPFSLDYLTSSSNTLFIERSLADALVPGRTFGFATGISGESWTVAAGVFGNDVNVGATAAGTAGTARATWAPILTETTVLHLAVAGSYRAFDRRSDPFSFASGPESNLVRTSLIDTDTLEAARSASRLGVEAAYQVGAWRLQGEYIWSEVERFGALPSSRFQGGYVEAGWTVNGDGRPYEIKPDYGAAYATFGRPKLDDGKRVSRGGPGIVELGLRVSYLDLADRSPVPSADVRGGRQVNGTLGVNWWPEPNLRLSANYVRAQAFGSPAVSDRPVRADIFIGRVQVDW